MRFLKPFVAALLCSTPLTPVLAGDYNYSASKAWGTVNGGAIDPGSATGHALYGSRAIQVRQGKDAQLPGTSMSVTNAGTINQISNNVLGNGNSISQTENSLQGKNTGQITGNTALVAGNGSTTLGK